MNAVPSSKWIMFWPYRRPSSDPTPTGWSQQSSSSSRVSVAGELKQPDLGRHWFQPLARELYLPLFTLLPSPTSLYSSPPPNGASDGIQRALLSQSVASETSQSRARTTSQPACGLASTDCSMLALIAVPVIACIRVNLAHSSHSCCKITDPLHPLHRTLTCDLLNPYLKQIIGFSCAKGGRMVMPSLHTSTLTMSRPSCRYQAAIFFTYPLKIVSLLNPP